MSYQPPPPQQSNSFSSPTTAAPNFPIDSMNRYLPPNTTTAAAPPKTGFANGLPSNSPVPNTTSSIKQQYLPPQQNIQKPPLAQVQSPMYSNGLTAAHSNQSSRTASPALNQPINSAFLPPTNASLGRPNAYGASIPPPPTTTNVAQSNPSAVKPAITSPAVIGNSTTFPPSQSQPTVDRLTNNLQQINLNNGNNGIATNGYPSPNQQQPQQVNKLVNGNSTQPRPNVNVFPPTATPSTQQQQYQNAGIPTSVPPLNRPPMPNNSIASPLPPMTTSTSVPNHFQSTVHSQQQQQLQQQYPNQNQFNNGYGHPTYPSPIQNQPNVLPPPPTSASITNQAPTVGKRPLYPSTQTTQPPSFQQQQQQQAFNNGSAGQPAFYPQSTNAQSPVQQYQYQQPSVVQQGFNRLWGQNTIDLMQQRHILPTLPVEPPRIGLDHEFYESVNCSPDIIRSTLTKIPESNSLLQKSRLPFGILIHPFRDLNNLPVIQCSTIVRCRACRTYINPFVYFVDSKKWKCNLCYRINELPDEFQYDPVSKSYGDVTRRPEVKSSTIEFIAPSEYMLRPPQPAIYLFLLDVSLIAQQTGYLKSVCESLIEQLDAMPGDARTQVGFIAYDSAVHFYSVAESFNQPHEITIVDIDDIFLPRPDNLLINLNECKEMIKDLLTMLPTRFAQTHDSNSALGAALQVAYKMMQHTGGRVTVFQTCLPNIGPGALQSRENPNERSSKEVHHMGPATDFYKRLALECSGQQIAVDLFLMNSQYSDLATISGISKFSGGCIHHFPLYSVTKPQMVDSFKRCFERYLTRKIGFESVMRVRCTRGLAIHTFHGNFFVRSTDLLSLPNVSPDAGFGMQISYEENLGESKTVCFQAALLYTSSKGERRIRVHTLCLPVSNSLSDIIHGADSQAIIGLIAKMAVDRSLQSSLSDARDAFINASCDIFSAFRTAQNIKPITGQFLAPMNLSLLPLYMLALLKHTAFRTGTSTRLDDRVYAMCELKSLPLDQLMRYIYPDLYHLDCLFSEQPNNNQSDERPEPPILQLSSEFLKSRSMFLLDCGTTMLLLVGSQVPQQILQNVFGISTLNEIPDLCFELPSTGTTDSENLHAFLETVNMDKPYSPTIQIIRDNSPYRTMFTEKLVDDRNESSLSYYEFLQHLQSQIK